MPSGQVFSSIEKEERWLKFITRNFTASLGIDPVVYQVPQSVRDTKPKAYTPQKVGLGPYHHFRHEVQQMQRQKQKDVTDYLSGRKFPDLDCFVEKFLEEKSKSPSFRHPEQKLETMIPLFYDRYLDFNIKTLACLVAIDGIYLLQFFNEDSKWEDQQLVADIMMLENQIPLFLLQEVRKALWDPFPPAPDIQLLDQFYRFCSKQSPLKLSDRSRLKNAAFERHMLHFMYKLIVNNYADIEGQRQGGSQNPSVPCSTNVIELARRLISEVRDAVHRIVVLVTSAIQEAQTQGLKIPEKVEKVFTLLQQLKKVSYLYNERDQKDGNRLSDEIEVPSVSQLHHLGKFIFATTKGGIRNIRLDGSTIYLPEITIGENTEVVLRNLVAYEAVAMPEHTLELSDYVDLMCGIIDAEIDAKVLKDFGIIKGGLAEKEIVRIFNGINKSTQGSYEESAVQKAVRDVNNKFNNLRIVKAYKFIDKSLQSLTRRIFPILVLIFLALQTVCEFYGCSSRRFGYAAVPAASSVMDGSSFGLDAEAKLMLPRKVLRFTG